MIKTPGSNDSHSSSLVAPGDLVLEPVNKRLGRQMCIHIVVTCRFQRCRFLAHHQAERLGNRIILFPLVASWKRHDMMMLLIRGRLGK
jgi:hypothetical protein